MKDFRELVVWRKSHELTLQIYKHSAAFPKAEVYGLTSQLRRASVSIPANIAEGCGRTGDAELARFLTIATGSANETDYLLLLARDLNYLADDTYGSIESLLKEVKRMLATLIRKVQSDRP